MTHADPKTVVLVGHGSKDAEGTRQFFELAARMGEQLPSTLVRSCLLEFQPPTLAHTWAELVLHGATHIHVAPLLLFAAGHAKDDIPQIVAACQSKTPHVSFAQSQPISRHRAVIRLVVDRVSGAVGQGHSQSQSQSQSQSRGQTGATALIMVGRGNRDPCARTDMCVLSEVVSRRVEVEQVFTAFYAMAKPSLVETLERVAGSGRFDTMIVHPHLLFSGHLFQAISQQVAQAAKRFSSVEFRLLDYLGPDPLVAEAIVDRIRQTSALPGKRTNDLQN